MWVEIHLFQGRMYVTGTWAFSGGVRVEDGVTARRLGELVAEQLHRPAEDGAWQGFCETVAGVTVRQFRPEKRVRAFTTGGAWQVDAKPQDPEAPAHPVADGDPAALGSAVLRELAALDPRWPVVRRVLVTTMATGELYVMSSAGGHTAGPDTLLDTVRRALAEADDAVLGAPAGIDGRLLHGGAEVIVDELSDGTVRLTGHGIANSRPTPYETRTGLDGVLELIHSLPAQHLPPGTPTGAGFGFKCMWLAVRGRGTAEVAAAIGRSGGRPVGWDEGVGGAYKRRVFVSPPTAGWVFVVGALLPFDGLAVAGLSERLGAEVQFFGTHRVSEYHEWALARGGRLVRRLRCDGSSGAFEQQGAPTPVEVELGVADDAHISEMTVMRVAAAWSLDPNTLPLVESSPEPGLLFSGS
ncbi:hypothetical protein KZZ52_13425 [Dactylosporangium sp. AC04546]|uniref:hypothetical protein n=1 Tax=Dactylosporangium sp. AC04546 TaxID=2862460 RepID=UPI001EE0EF80|nr:hypothetical protein [Dactylosporangium sp. AC04546]WVK86328.1 hypothetical protein KZZ52_13425 [Dactylosporangium sp. AC04546]